MLFLPLLPSLVSSFSFCYWNLNVDSDALNFFSAPWIDLPELSVFHGKYVEDLSPSVYHEFRNFSASNFFWLHFEQTSGLKKNRPEEWKTDAFTSKTIFLQDGTVLQITLHCNIRRYKIQFARNNSNLSEWMFATFYGLNTLSTLKNSPRYIAYLIFLAQVEKTAIPSSLGKLVQPIRKPIWAHLNIGWNFWDFFSMKAPWVFLPMKVLLCCKFSRLKKVKDFCKVIVHS